ncbi:MAG: FxLYD domain-containing protein [Alphaproteobacteria bacterium]|nr:FxLYD domain-containing protein [Alphaproteobacteria bacterium]
MNAIWKVLNSPLVVVLIALALWPLLSTLSARYAWQNVVGGITGEVAGAYTGLKDTQVKRDRARMAAIDGMEVTAARLVAGRYAGRQKVIGTVKNAGSGTVKQVKMTISYFDGTGELIDVGSTWLGNIAFLKPGESANFSAARGYDRKAGQPAARVTVKVTNVNPVDDAAN